MAFPPRPGMIPPFGMPPMHMGGPPPPHLRGPPPAGGYRGPPPTHSAPPMMNPDVGVGPPVTVFVGNITERAQDAMIRHLLTTNGPIVSWKRVQGATGRLQGFGFCEYANPDAAARAIRLLHDMMIGDKKLVVKVDAKTKGVLDEYKKERRKKMTGKSPTQEEQEGTDEEFMDPAMKHEDQMAKDRIAAILQDHSKEMMNYVPHDSRKPKSRDENAQTGPKESLDDVEMEENKRDIINREIDKFRETMKIREAEKEEEKKKREERESESRRRSESKRRSRERSSRPHRSTSRSRTRSPSRPRSPRRDRERDRDRDRLIRDRDRDRDRNRSRRPQRSRSRSRDRDRRPRPGKDSWRDLEKDEEERELRRAEKKAREKEVNYQERLRKWELREGKQQAEYDKEKKKEEKRIQDQDLEAQKLREFLEDYDDDRDDEKYYKGRELERRLYDREKEGQRDAEDRTKEREEIEELKAQIAKEGFADPDAELHRRMTEEQHDKNNKPTSVPTIIVQNGTAVAMQQEDEVTILEQSDSFEPPPDEESNSAVPTFAPFSLGGAEASRGQSASPGPASSVIPPPAAASESSTSSAAAVPSTAAPQMMKQPLQVSGRKKLDVKDVFNQDDDDGGLGLGKKKLPSLAAELKAKKEEHKSAEDKRKHIKSLIEKIPTDKNALFEYKVDWDMMDNQLMEKRIKPWVNRKTAEYIGEPEPSLTEFICGKVLTGASPKTILEDVQVVLDDEAEVFVVKLWRLLIYEIENKKHKATLST